MGAWESESDDRLLVAASDDIQAFPGFYRRYERPVLAYFVRRTRNPEVAADLTAEVFAAALASCARFKPGETPASAWLFAIAQHKLANSRRRGRVEDRARRRLGMEPVVLEDEDFDRIERLGDEDALIRLLDGLPEDQREAVRARVLDERSYERIAEELTCSPSVVRKRVSRGLARLREQLGEQSP
jgi:RNA polymerase sigma-70 factor (ECF subfamily)